MATDLTDRLSGRIAAEVRAELARQAITQQELGERLGYTQWWVSRRVTGLTPFTAAEIIRVAEVLGVPVTNFLVTPERAA